MCYVNVDHCPTVYSVNKNSAYPRHPADWLLSPVNLEHRSDYNTAAGAHGRTNGSTEHAVYVRKPQIVSGY